ncbi:MAG: transporter substrate-binding domain-containing protein, partial [Candidatus Riflebacteria bacterium]
MSKKLLVLFMYVALCSVCAFAGEKISIRADVWMPYNGEPGSDKPGYGIELINEIFKAKNIEVDYQNMPWNRAIEETRVGKFDCIIGAGKRDAEGFLFPEESMGFSLNNLFVKAGNPFKYAGLESIAGLKIGIIADYSYAEFFDKYVEQYKDDPKRIFVATGDNALEKMAKMVTAGRLDGFIENPLVVSLEEWKNDVGSAGEIEG